MQREVARGGGLRIVPFVFDELQRRVTDNFLVVYDQNVHGRKRSRGSRHFQPESRPLPGRAFQNHEAAHGFDEAFYN